MKFIELLIFITFISFLILFSINSVSSFLEKYREDIEFLERFYLGRSLIKNLTEKQPFSNNICNLTSDFFNLFNESFFREYILENKITYPIQIIAKNLKNNESYKIGGVSNEYIEFRRVCYYNDSLYLVILRI